METNLIDAFRKYNNDTTNYINNTLGMFVGVLSNENQESLKNATPEQLEEIKKLTSEMNKQFDLLKKCQ